MKKLALLLLAAPFAAALSGCVSFGGKPPKVPFLTLEAAEQIKPGDVQTPASGTTVTVLFPTVPHELATTRVPVHSGENAVAYVKDAQWVEAPPRLFARLVGDTIAARTGRPVLSYRQSQIDPGAVLSGELRQFGVDADSNEAVVQFDALLVQGDDATKFQKRRFEARAPLAEVTPDLVAKALNQAANQVAVQVADWVGK
ncbi:ABC-type transport auxiliary lipoprotein family protein [Sphingomonas sp. CBMAI 2297]|uniref:ABC-type transport auxiliary lipoprotein family protein n=1 Tax=Sphingomonas sp. CBMAI 2297 TaxID=2991720 RepID=UPI002454F436|nr:ABC-type transport auxiliary lipoprotein family protein [Sphingomonas sp. CBMAI 2297]MDH4742593.1 ABC-type transport auxiliary lipoprotein family protein [Sphingomonas sp. CBMAI 2297]